MGVATLSAAWLAQPFFKSIDISLVYYGVLWAFLNVTAGFSSVNSYKYEQKHNIPNLLLILGILMSLSFFVIYFLPNYYGLILIFSEISCFIVPPRELQFSSQLEQTTSTYSLSTMKDTFKFSNSLLDRLYFILLVNLERSKMFYQDPQFQSFICI